MVATVAVLEAVWAKEQVVSMVVVTGLERALGVEAVMVPVENMVAAMVVGEAAVLVWVMVQVVRMEVDTG